MAPLKVSILCLIQLFLSLSLCNLTLTLSNGVKVRCPPQPHKQNGTDCIESGTCYKGVCVSFCETRGQVSCICNDVAESCLRCCRMNSTSPCEKYNTKMLLSDGRPCLQGYCKNGVCKKTVKNLIQRLFKFARSLNISKLIEFFRTNIVGSVIVFTLFFWVPICSYIEYRDKLREKQESKEGDIIENLEIGYVVPEQHHEEKEKKKDRKLNYGPVIQTTEV